MVIERSGAGQSHPPVPIHEIHKKDSTLPAINVQMAQLSRQLTQLIDQLQRQSNNMQTSQEDKILTNALDPLQTTTRENKKNHVYLIEEDRLIEIKLKRLRKRRRIAKFINSAFIFFGVIGITAALFAAIVLFFHGPAMI